MSYATKQLAENKLIILYLVDKMGIPLSNSEICQFILEHNFADYFTVQQYISELVNAEYLEQTKENNSTRYVITDAGVKVLSFFLDYISPSNKQTISTFIHENTNRIKMEYQITANVFLELNDEFLVKCGVYESDGSTMMEVNVMVPTQAQAKVVANNWKKNVNNIYKSILITLLQDQSQNQGESDCETCSEQSDT